MTRLFGFLALAILAGRAGCSRGEEPARAPRGVSSRAHPCRPGEGLAGRPDALDHSSAPADGQQVASPLFPFQCAVARLRRLSLLKTASTRVTPTLQTKHPCTSHAHGPC